MKIIVDANILFAALIKENVSYDILYEKRFNFFTPEYIFTEFTKHKEEILSKTDRTSEEFYRTLKILKRKISIISLKDITPFLSEAEKTSPDKDDIVYIASAFKLNCHIWSNDKNLKEKQNKIKVYNTEEIMKL
tara:strand:- start:5418 stop:5819 length:402 start_codon:yes stop_codon:yes gene_type:complete